MREHAARPTNPQGSSIVFRSIRSPDFARIRNIVIEVDYSDQIGATASDVEALLAPKGYRTDRREDMVYAWRA